jgi:hypothetical protein
MRSGTKPLFARSALWRLGVSIVTAILPLALLACASSPKQATLPSLTSRLEAAAVQAPQSPAAAPKATAAEAVRAKQPAPAAAQEADTQNPLQAFAMVSEKDLQEMRGCLGVYYFDYTFDINMVASPEVSVSSKFTAAVPDGTSPSFNGTTAMFKDNNVLYMAGPTSGGLMSEVIVTGRDNFVIANTQFNIHIPNAALISPTINVLPAATLTGIGGK